MPAEKSVAQFWLELGREIRAGQLAALDEGSKLLYQATKDELAKGSPGRGRRYRRGRKYHRASRPGDAPARDFGDLAKAIRRQLHRGRHPHAEVGVNDTAPHAKFLDPPRGKREPGIGRRPFLTTAYTKNEGRVRQTMQRVMEQRLKRVIR